MYAESVICDTMNQFAQREGWMPEPHTLAQVEEFDVYLKKVIDIDTTSRSTYLDFKIKLSKNRADEIRQFVRNEQAMCVMDSSYWETRYAYVCDEKANIFKYKNRRAQEIFDQIVAGFEENNFSIELLILKARQQGISTKVALKFLHRLLFVPYSRAIMASVKAEKSELLAKMLEVCRDMQPFWLVPRPISDRPGKKLEFDNGSILSVQSGSQATGIAQGWTPSLVHISEIGDIPNPRKVLEEGLFKATHSSRKLFACYEGTGNGNTGWLADKWRYAKENYPKGLSRLCPIFIPWPMASDLFPERDWIRKYPVPEGWQPAKETRKHIHRCQSFIRHTDYLARVMGRDWEMPREQQWFWEFNYKEALATHTVKTWLSQMAADDSEALQGKNDAIFEPETIEVITTNRKREFQDYAILGDSIDDGFEPSPGTVDYNKERIRVQWHSNRGQKYDWEMVPLFPIEDEEEKDVLGRIRVFEEPILGGRRSERADYSCGIDTADGLGVPDEDRSSLQMTRNEKDDGCDVQVAEFVSDRVNAPQMVGFAACLAAWYGEETKDPRGVKFVIEQRMRPGDDCQLQLKLMGFNFHHIDVPYDDKNVKENKGRKQGWYTREYNRHLLMDRFIDAVKNGWYKPNSIWLIKELENLERKRLSSGKTKTEHQSGKHDDRVLSAAISYFTRHALDVLAARSQKRYAQPTGKLPEIDFSPSSIGQMSVGSW